MDVNNYICVSDKVNGVKFSNKIIQPGGKKHNVRTLLKLSTIKYIVVHNTGNARPTASARAHADWLQDVENSDSQEIGWHITVDCDEAIQHIPFNETAYHAGNHDCNHTSLGVEIAENKDYLIAEQNGVKIVCALMKQYSIPIENVLPHRQFDRDRKLCPHNILVDEAHWETNWKMFQKRIEAQYKQLYKCKLLEFFRRAKNFD